MLMNQSTCPEVRLSKPVQMVRCTAQNSDKKTWGSYYSASAISQRITVMFCLWFAAVWKANGSLPLVSQKN